MADLYEFDDDPIISEWLTPTRLRHDRDANGVCERCGNCECCEHMVTVSTFQLQRALEVIDAANIELTDDEEAAIAALRQKAS